MTVDISLRVQITCVGLNPLQAYTIILSVADPEGAQGVRLNPPSRPTFLNIL